MSLQKKINKFDEKMTELKRQSEQMATEYTKMPNEAKRKMKNRPGWRSEFGPLFEAYAKGEISFDSFFNQWLSLRFPLI